MSVTKKYKSYTIHRNKRVAEFWANRRDGTYLGYKDDIPITIAIEKSGTTKIGHDKGGHLVGYDKEDEFEIRTSWSINEWKIKR